MIVDAEGATLGDSSNSGKRGLVHVYYGQSRTTQAADAVHCASTAAAVDCDCCWLISGQVGPAGLRGSTGPVGAPGLPGANGALGDTGFQGAVGSPGNTGATGGPGGIGPSGPAGLRGTPPLYIRSVCCLKFMLFIYCPVVIYLFIYLVLLLLLQLF